MAEHRRYIVRSAQNSAVRVERVLQIARDLARLL
jgi:hypothetical protein